MNLKCQNNNYAEYCLFLFSATSVLINKYVLSTLKFTIPTVFQGWQTFVCVLLLTTLMRWKRLSSEIQWLDRGTLMKLMFHLICFSVGNVAGSKALALLPVGVFLCGSNLVPATLLVLNASKNPNNDAHLGCAVIWSSALILFFSLSKTYEGWFWLSVFAASALLQAFSLSRLHLPSVNVFTLIYYRNFSSVLLLLPLSIYLEEAAQALQHPRVADFEFFIGCLLSGILGTGAQLFSGHLDNKPNLPICLGISRLFTSLFSALIFTSNVPLLCWFLIVVNLTAGVLISVIDDETDDIQHKPMTVV